MGIMVKVPQFPERVNFASVELLIAYLNDSNTDHLDISNNRIGPEGVKHLVTYLPSKLTYLAMIWNKTCPKWMQCFFTRPAVINLTSLDISWNKIGGEGMKLLSQHLPNTGLTYLDIGHNKIGNEWIELLSQHLPNTGLTYLDISYNNIGDKGIKDLFLSLKKNSKLTSLNVIGNKITSKGMEHLPQYLPDSLTYLDISNNNIGNEGVQYLSICLKETKLATLKINDININGEGIGCLSTLPNTITFLDISCNYICSEGVRHLSQHLKNTKLSTLDISHSYISHINTGPKIMQYLAPLLSESNLTTLNTSHNAIGDEGIEYLAPLLSKSRLITLNISNNNIGDEGMKCLSQQLSESQLNTLDICGNNITPAYVHHFVSYNLSRTNLTHLLTGHGSNNLGFSNTNIIMFDNQKTPLWDKCSNYLELLTSENVTERGDLLLILMHHKPAMLGVAKEKGGEYLNILKCLYLKLLGFSTFDKGDHNYILESLSGNVSVKAKSFANKENLTSMVSKFIEDKSISGFNTMAGLLTNETCFKYLLESCKKNPGFVDDITAKIFCLSLISKCPNLDRVGKYSPYALKCAMETLKNINPEEEMPEEISYHDLVSNQVVVIDSGAFMSDIGDVMRKCLNENYVFSEE